MLLDLFPCCLTYETDEHNNREPLIDSNFSAIPRWRLLSGENHWKGLLRPLDIDLRRYLIHYGEMAQSTVDAFNRDTHSKYAGKSRYSKERFFQSVGLDHKNRPYKYEVTKFLYATSDLDGFPEGLMVVPLSREGAHATRETNWMGYVAVAKDESVAALGRRDVVVAWRGSVMALEWISDFLVGLVPAPEILGEAAAAEEMVHQGFYSVYTSENPNSLLGKTSARHQVLKEIKRLVEKYNDEELSITVTGHSLGAALATLTAVDIVANNLNRKHHHHATTATSFPVTAILFGSPKVGNFAFQTLFSNLERHGSLRVLRVRNTPDAVPSLPFVGYEAVGDEVAIDTRKSKYLKEDGSFQNFHNLEVYLHGVAGDHGWWWWKRFRLVVERDIALVNKSMDNLKDEYMIPVGWWVEENKGMVQRDDGAWIAMEYDDDDDDE